MDKYVVAFPLQNLSLFPNPKLSVRLVLTNGYSRRDLSEFQIPELQVSPSVLRIFLTHIKMQARTDITERWMTMKR